MASLHLGVAGHVDDEVDPRVRDELAEVGADRDVEAPGQLEPGRPGIDVGDPDDGHGGIAREHLEQGAPALARADDDDLGHARGPASEAAGPPGGLGEALEGGVLGDERHLDLAGGPVALLADDDVGHPVAVLRLQAVALGPVEEEDHVGVLLERARLAQVGELRLLALAGSPPRGRAARAPPPARSAPWRAP